MDAGTPNKLVLVQRLAMALGYVALVNNDRVAVSVLDGRELRRLPAMRGRRSIQRLAWFILDEVHPRAAGEASRSAVPAPSFAAALRTIASSRSGKGVMVVMSDFLIPEGYQEGLKYLAGAGTHGYDTYCIQVLSPGEIDPASEGVGRVEAGDEERLVGDLRLTDAETNRIAEVTITGTLLKKYRAAAAAYIADFNAFCTARGMVPGLVRSDADLQTLLLDYLRKRGLLR
jgi:uncharacterized protein (DUF58 family)